MKTYRSIFWVTTSFLFLFESVMPALTSHTELAIEGIRHLGFPDYFRIQLTICKVIGGIVLIVPTLPHRLKEWAYVGFAITSLSAFVAHWVVDGFGLEIFLPLLLLTFVAASYVTWYLINPTMALERSHASAKPDVCSQ